VKKKSQIEATLAELQAEILQYFTQAADCRAQAREYSEQAEQYDACAQWLRVRIERLQSDLVVIEIEARGEK
jgi:uncharacterized coiled-coil DUF342 family protein